MDEKLGVCCRNLNVVVKDWDARQDLIQEALPCLTVPVVGEEHTNLELGDGDRRDCRVVVVFDELIKNGRRSLGIDEEGCVEQQSSHGRCCNCTSSRVAARSSTHDESAGYFRSMSLMSPPRPDLTGSR